MTPLSREAEFRLIKHLTFLETELQDFPLFRAVTHDEYLSDRNRRRNLERWIENLVNSTVDVAKLILNAEGLPVPDTYREIVEAVPVSVCGKETAKGLARWVRLRNVISHEYLDIKWAAITKFVAEAEPQCQDFLRAAKVYVAAARELES